MTQEEREDKDLLWRLYSMVRVQQTDGDKETILWAYRRITALKRQLQDLHDARMERLDVETRQTGDRSISELLEEIEKAERRAKAADIACKNATRRYWDLRNGIKAVLDK